MSNTLERKSFKTSLISGWFLSFVLSMDDLIISSFVGGPEATTLPMVIYSSVKFGISPEINALATLIIFLATLSLTIAYFLHTKQKKAHARAKHSATRAK